MSRQTENLCPFLSCLRNRFALAVICCLIYHWLGFLGNTGPDPLKNQKDLSQRPMHYVGSMVFDPLSLQKKFIGRVGHSLTKLSGSAHAIPIWNHCQPL